ncbi:efflux transporter periplasmic adaptor subunit, partial [Acinetobacter baumannii]
AKAKRQYKQTAANSSSLNSQVVVRADEINSAKAQVAQAQADYDKAALAVSTALCALVSSSLDTAPEAASCARRFSSKA